MNYWTELSIEYANQRSYLNDLTCIYPTIQEGISETSTMFNQWIQRKSLGILPVNAETFLKTKENTILEGNEDILLNFANTNFGYKKENSLDFIARFNGNYVLGEAKFMIETDENEEKSFADIISTLKTDYKGAICICILDGISIAKYYKKIIDFSPESMVLSALVLLEFLYSLPTKN